MQTLTRKLKVAHLTTVALSLRLFLLNQLESIQDAGFAVTAISAGGPDVAAVEALGIRHIDVSMTRKFSPIADLVSLWRLYTVMRREAFTIVHTHTPKGGLLGQLAASMAGVPVIVNTVHGFYFHDNTPPLSRRFYVLTEKLAATCSDLIFSQNSEDIATAVAEGICRPDQIEYLGNGIDVVRFDRLCISDEELSQKRGELGISSDSKVIGFVGRLVAEKGIIELLEAAQLILQRYPKTQFLVVGPVDDQKRDAITPEITQKYGVSDSFIFTGMRQDMPQMYALMDIFVLPSHREGFPRSAMEASAMGIPVVATDIRGCREVVEAGRNGLLVPPGKVADLADAIMQLFDDQEQMQRMGDCGRTIARERFDERQVFQRIQAAYHRLLLEKGVLPQTGPQS
jgi:glycosyltransferase involved in cell wall biosynthesis